MHQSLTAPLHPCLRTTKFHSQEAHKLLVMNSHPTTPDRELLAAAVGTLGEEDLIFLNRLVIARLKELEQAKDTAQVAMFALADRVEFTTNECEVKQGFVVRLNKKSVSVRTDDEQDWKISPTLLRKIPGSIKVQFR